ncbi:AMP-binding protein [Marinobacter sp. OP 3.4]|uniref:AMP-binding protein n=1 Tax=Marinobacter sp. OP 3.4 TaxID=3076501 RepID=UPI002E1B5585
MTEYSLSTVMTCYQDPSAVVATDGRRTLDRAAFERRVRQWMAVLAPHPAHVFGIYLDDAGEFAALLMALWQCGRTPLLAGDNLPATVARLEKHASALIGSFAAPTSLASIAEPEPEAPEVATPFVSIPRDHAAVIVLTSGSTGEPRPVTMHLAQLEDEVAMHEAQWHDVAGQALVIGTVTHQHVYGLIWRVLWPLAGQRPLARYYSHYLEDVLAWSRECRDLVLVTTPSHLGRLPAHADWASARGAWRMVVSSTAPLATADSLAAGERFGVAVTEIFGSSETGGIAWRQQQWDPVWQTLPGITVGVAQEDDEGSAGIEGRANNEGPLVIRSPLLGHDHWFATGDQARVESGQRFTLLGRVDRIAKIEGKRVSLTAMERCLQDHEWVREARVVVLGGHRTRCAVVATLTDPGMEVLDQVGRRAFSGTLREWLASTFEAPVLPRHWRFPDELPRNAQGKVPQHLLAELFPTESLPAESPVRSGVHLPEVLASRVEGSEVTLRIRVQQELAYFQGHFPEVPVLPGVVQVHWAEHFARSLLGDDLPSRARFRRMEVVKFQQVIQPGQEVTVVLSLDRARGRLGFRFHDGDIGFSSGRLVFVVEGNGQ